jgi:hypothetical protein
MNLPACHTESAWRQAKQLLVQRRSREMQILRFAQSEHG